MNEIKTNHNSFQIIYSTDYKIIAKTATEWECTSAKIQEIYKKNIERAQGNERKLLEEEQWRFNEHETVSWLISLEANSGQQKHHISKVSFHLCLDNQNQIEGIMVLSNIAHTVGKDSFLKLESLVTHPKNIQSTLNLERPSLPVRGIGKKFLQTAEKIARERNLAGIYLCATNHATSFYLKSDYIDLNSPKIHEMIKRIEPSAAPFLNAGNF